MMHADYYSKDQLKIAEALHCMSWKQHADNLKAAPTYEDFLQPFLWFRSELPLVFGHVLGKGTRLLIWGRRLWRSGLSLG